MVAPTRTGRLRLFTRSRALGWLPSAAPPPGVAARPRGARTRRPGADAYAPARAARPVAAGSRGSSGDRGAHCRPRTSRTATSLTRATARRDVVEDRTPEIVRHHDDGERAVGHRERCTDLEVELRPARRAGHRADRRRQQITIDGDDAHAPVEEPASVTATAARHVEHDTIGWQPTDRTVRSTATPSSLVRHHDRRPPAYDSTTRSASRRITRQPHDVVDVVEARRPVEVGHVVVAVLLHDDVRGARRQRRRRARA